MQRTASRLAVILLVLVSGCSRAQDRADAWRVKADEAMDAAFRIQRAADDAQRIAREAQATAEEWRRAAQAHEAVARNALAAAEGWKRQYERSWCRGGGCGGTPYAQTLGPQHFDKDCNLVPGGGSADDPPGRCIATTSLTVLDGISVAQPQTRGPLQSITGRVLAQCIESPKTDAEFLAWLRALPAGDLGLVGYVDADGQAQVLTRELLTQP